MPTYAKALTNFWTLLKEDGLLISLRVAFGKAQRARARRQREGALYQQHIRALGRPMYLDLDDEGLSKTLALRGVHEPRSTALVRQELEPGMTVLDIGANMGYYVLLAADLIGPTGHIYAVEPVPSTYEILLKNLALNQISNVTSEAVALSAVAGEAEMQVTDKRNWAHIQHPHMKSERAKATFSGVRTSITIPTTTLDDFVEKHRIEAIHFIRMDVEGFETAVIQGGGRILAAYRPCKILMEMHPFFADDLAPFAEMVKTLYAAGFRAKRVIHHKDAIIAYPSQEELIDYLSRPHFREAPHVLFVAE